MPAAQWERANAAYIRENTKSCPQCHVQIEKNGTQLINPSTAIFNFLIIFQVVADIWPVAVASMNFAGYVALDGILDVKMITGSETVMMMMMTMMIIIKIELSIFDCYWMSLKNACM